MQNNEDLLVVVPYDMVRGGAVAEIVRTHELLRVARSTGAFKAAQHLEWLIEHRDRTGTWDAVIHSYNIDDPQEEVYS